MNQLFSAQALTRKALPLLPLHFVEREGVRQAIGAKKILFQNATYLQQIAANEASGAGTRPGIEKICFNMKHTCNRLLYAWMSARIT